MSQNLVNICLVGIFLFFSLSDVVNGQYRNVVDVIGKPMFNVAVLRSKKPAVVFYYSSSQCQPCNWNLLPMLDKMAEKKAASIRVFKVDLDKVDLKEEHGITRIPTTMTYFEGDPYDVAEGGSWGGIVALVNKATKIQS